MQKVIAVGLYALLVVGALFTLPEPMHASCDAYCLLESCQLGPSGIHYGWTRASGDLFVILTTPQHCVFPDNLYVSCQERNYGCASANGATYKIDKGTVFAFDQRGRLQSKIPANVFNVQHQKEMVASIRTCQSVG